MKEVQDRSSGAFLVRVLVEPREETDQAPVKRYYMRDLKTGEVHYFTSPRELTEQIGRQTDTRLKSASEQDGDNAADAKSRVLG